MKDASMKISGGSISIKAPDEKDRKQNYLIRIEHDSLSRALLLPLSKAHLRNWVSLMEVILKDGQNV